MTIRKAIPEDSSIIATLMMLAMEDIVYQFIGETGEPKVGVTQPLNEVNSKEKATRFLIDLISKKNTQYSYENCWVVEIENEINSAEIAPCVSVVAVAVVYDGAKLLELREPVANKIKSMFGREFNPENETQAGEFYIDCFAVSPHLQGKGIGSRLFRFLIDEYVFKQKETLGLLVDKDNPDAKKLYLKLGFEMVGEQTLAGKSMEHLQFKNHKK
jgi:ribosomal protein S18 acetylase RimI-like enzyme